LRQLRRAAGLTGQELADAFAWPPSKVSKIENGRQTPTDSDVRSWCRATSANDDIDDLLASLHTLEERHREWQRVLRAGLAAAQNVVARDEARTQVFRSFQPTMVPGLLQTPGYARTRMEQGARNWGATDLDEAVAARMARQAILYQPIRKFYFVLTESALMNALCAPEVMLVQIDRLMSLAMLPNVRLGIVPFEKQFRVAPEHAFWIMDERLVAVETFSAQLDLTQPQEIDLYLKVFETLALDADYDRKAHAHLTRAARAVEKRLNRKDKTE
jgi:transcriptional regulator with XRE-family HTH domain